MVSFLAFLVVALQTLELKKILIYYPDRSSLISAKCKGNVRQETFQIKASTVQTTECL